MGKFCESYEANRAALAERLGARESFDVIERRLEIAGREAVFFYVDGFVKDTVMQKLMQELTELAELGGAEETLRRLAYIEVELTESRDAAVAAVLAGQSAFLAESFGGKAILIDARSYPARGTAEPDSDRVMRGAHDGFVETLITNTALIRRRVRDERLRMRHFNLGGSSKTDVAVCYLVGVADSKLVESICRRIAKLAPRSLTLGFQSLAESLVRSGWLNPFPKVRSTERPDTAAAQLVEGSVLVLCDTAPQAMILPTSLFDFIQQADDFCFTPLTGSYLRLLRTAILLLSVVVTPLWYLALEYAHLLPASLSFLVPRDAGAIPIIAQLFLTELAIDGLKLASMNTPDMLTSSLSVIGALILGDFAVTVGWLCPDVILYMAFVAIASFAQQNSELGYAFKFMRLLLLALTAALGVLGFAVGILAIIAIAATTRTVTGRRYLYPLVPFNARALRRLFIREKKSDLDGGDAPRP